MSVVEGMLRRFAPPAGLPPPRAVGDDKGGGSSAAPGEERATLRLSFASAERAAELKRRLEEGRQLATSGAATTLGVE